MKKHLARGIKVYDPYVNTKIAENQYFSFDEFLNDIDFIVILVAHDQIKNNMEKIKDKIIFDTRNCCYLPKAYKL